MMLAGAVGALHLDDATGGPAPERGDSFRGKADSNVLMRD